MKKLLLAALAVVLATPAFAAVQNVKVSGDIVASYLNRRYFDAGLDNVSISNPFGANGGGLNAQSVWATQTRVRIDADLTDNVSTTVRFINETVWDGSYGDGTGFSSQDIKAVDIDLAYVTLREFLYSPLTLTIGRQEIVMGNGFIIGGGPNQFTSGHFNQIAGDLTEVIAVDGIKAVLDYKPLTLTAFWYKNNQLQAAFRGLYSNSNANSDVFGLNGNYQLSDPFNTVLEAYTFARIDGKNLPPTTNGLAGISTNQDKNNTLYVPGLRVSTNPIKGLNVQAEYAWQFGQVEVQNVGTIQQQSERRNANAAQLMASYSLPVYEKYKPTVNASWTYVSGDKNGAQNQNIPGISNSAKTFTAWDQFAKNQSGGTIYDTLFPLSDMYIWSVGASVSPIQDVTAAFSWSGLWSAARFSNPAGGNVGGNPLFIYQPNQSSTTTTGANVNYIASKGKNTTLGNEYDANFIYNYTEDVTFGLSLGWFVWGSAFSHINNEHFATASQAIADISVKF